MIAERSRFEIVVDRVARAIVRRWLGITATILALYAGLPWLSPLLRSWGYEALGVRIFEMYARLCHQFPERSFFVGDYQVCYCHRCTALYTSLLFMTLLYALIRWQRPISRRVLVLLTLPIVIDGTWHLLDDALPWTLRSVDSSVGSLNFWIRMATGMLVAIGGIAWAYPRLERELRQIEPQAA